MIFNNIFININCNGLMFVSLCSINNKLQQYEAAAGVLEYAMKHHKDLVGTC